MTPYTILKSKIFTIGIVVIVGWLLLSVIRITSHENVLIEKERVLSSRIGQMEQENEVLSEEVAYGQHPAYLEKEARQKLNLKAPDEEVLFVYNGEISVVANIASSSVAVPFDRLPNYKKWIYYVLGRK